MDSINKIKIRKPSLGDISKLITLWQGQYDYHHNLDSTYYVPNSKKLDQKFEQYLKKSITKNNPHILIAESGDKFIGFITYKKAEADYFDTNIIKHGDVLELYVETAYRNRGVGKKLMEEVEKFFKNEGLKFMSLQCSIFNENALDFYSKSGFINRQSLLYKKI